MWIYENITRGYPSGCICLHLPDVSRPPFCTSNVTAPHQTVVPCYYYNLVISSAGTGKENKTC